MSSIQEHKLVALEKYLRTRLSPREVKDAIAILHSPDSPEVFTSLHVIGRALDKYFEVHPAAGYSASAMDKYIHEWKLTVQHSKPKGTTALRAFRRVMVIGERDY